MIQRDRHIAANKRGQKDHANGTVVGDNPYMENDSRHWFWYQGWLAAAKKQHKGTRA